MCPADNFETVQAIRTAVDYPRPVYIRFGKKPMPNLHSKGTCFEIGKAIQLTPKRENYDVALIATGETVAPTLFASQILDQQGKTSCVLSLHTLRPFDTDAVRDAALRSKVVVTVEEHSVNGGLGSRIASFLMQAGIFRPLHIMGIPDEYTVTGSQIEIFNHYGITSDGISRMVLHVLNAKPS